MQSELDEFPIIDRFQLISDKFLIKTFQSACHPIFPIINRLTNILRYSEPKLNQIKNFLLLKSYQRFGSYKPRVLNSATPLQFLLPYPSMFFQQSVDLSIGISIDNSPNPESVFNSFISFHCVNHTHFYTDWCKKTDSPVGFAIYAPFLDLDMHIGYPYLLRRLWLFMNLSNILLKKKSLSLLFSLMLRVCCRLLLVSQHCPLLHSWLLSFETFYILLIAPVLPSIWFGSLVTGASQTINRQITWPDWPLLRASLLKLNSLTQIFGPFPLRVTFLVLKLNGIRSRMRNVRVSTIFLPSLTPPIISDPGMPNLKQTVNLLLQSLDCEQIITTLRLTWPEKIFQTPQFASTVEKKIKTLIILSGHVPVFLHHVHYLNTALDDSNFSRHIVWSHSCPILMVEAFISYSSS